MTANKRARRETGPPEHAPLAADPAEGSTTDDTAARSLTRAERTQLGMDSWEPSLLRELLQAHNKLPTDEG